MVAINLPFLFWLMFKILGGKSHPDSKINQSDSPWSSNFIQAMSSPTHSTFQPGSVGHSMARLVFPQALGKAAAMYFFCPAGLVMPRIWRGDTFGFT